MDIEIENGLTDRHLLLFGRIVQSYARHEVLMEGIMAKVSGADATSVKLMTGHLPFGWKRAAMLTLLRHRGVPLDLIDEVQSFFEPLHTLLPLHDDITHSNWRQTEPETMIWPSWLNSGPTVAVKPVHDIGAADRTYIEDTDERAAYTVTQLEEAADRLDENEVALRNYLATADLTDLPVSMG